MQYYAALSENVKIIIARNTKNCKEYEIAVLTLDQYLNKQGTASAAARLGLGNLRKKEPAFSAIGGIRRAVAEREVKERLSPRGILSNVSELFDHLLTSNSTNFASGTSGDF